MISLESLKVLEFFKQHPNESFTINDLCDKFDNIEKRKLTGILLILTNKKFIDKSVESYEIKGADPLYLRWYKISELGKEYDYYKELQEQKDKEKEKNALRKINTQLKREQIAKSRYVN